jgi:hypothetical protein
MKKTMKDRQCGGENVMPVKAGIQDGTNVIPAKAGIYSGLISILLLLGSTGATAADQVYVCTPCPAGTYSDGTGTSCTPCPAGKYQPNIMAGSCDACPAGQYQNLTGQASCKACPSGKYCPVGTASPQTCPAGQAPNAAKTACTSCGSGTYYSEGGCKTCPSNASCPANADTFICNANYYSDGNKCIECPNDHYSFAGASYCNKLNCPGKTTDIYVGYQYYKWIECTSQWHKCRHLECFNGDFNGGYYSYCSSYDPLTLGADKWCEEQGKY